MLLYWGGMRYISWTSAFVIVGTCVAIWPIFPYVFSKRARTVDIMKPIIEPSIKPIIILDDDIFYRLFFLFVA